MPRVKILSDLYQKKLKPAQGWRTYLLIALLIFAGGVMLSYLITLDIQRRNQTQVADSVEGAMTYFSQILNRRMDNYEEVLRSGASLFHIAGNVTSSQWQEFTSGFDIKSRYAGTQSFGFAEYVTAGELPRHLDSLEQRGVDSYELSPPGQRDVYVPVVYAQLAVPPEEEITFGYDLYSDPTRAAALDLAIETADVVMTDPLTLRGDLENQPDTPGFVLYFPVYTDGQVLDTAEGRRANIAGFTSATLNIEELLIGLFGREALSNQNAGIQIKALTADGNKTAIYTSPTFETVSGQELAMTRILETNVHNKTWETTVAIASGNLTGAEINPKLVLTIGVLASIILAGLMFMLMVNRLFRTTVIQEEGIEQAKEDLLSLTSHQLRTPATGVKQYLGILLQGYAGDVERQQKAILKKAYDANERQLEIINQLLYVAKADVGQIRLEKKRHNFTALVREVLDDNQDTAKQKKVTFNFRRATPLWIRADAIYIRMIIENLISNAIKYSQSGSSISVSLTSQGKQAVLKVKDRGVGIPPEQHDRLFKKFSRIDNELSHEVSGSGIGLYLAQKLAEAHGGIIKVNSVIGVGSIFSLYVPGVIADKRRRGLKVYNNRSNK